MRKVLSQFVLVLLLVMAGWKSAEAAWYLKALKSNTIQAFKEPSSTAKVISVLNAGDEIEVIGQSQGWLKVKVPFSQGYFLYGWILKTTPGIQVYQRATGATPAPATTKPADQDFRPNQAVEEKETRERQKRSTGRRVGSEYDRWESEGNQFLRFFGGPVFNVKKYSPGELQYRFGMAYEIPFAERMKFGIPVSYARSNTFSSILVGVDTAFSFYTGPISISPKIGVSAEYLSGGGKSFYAVTPDLGISIEMAISESWQIGIEPFTIRAMVWNSLDSLNKIPFNLRGESLVLVRWSF